MKHRLGSITIEAIDTYVRVTAENLGGVDAKPQYFVTENETPEAIEIAHIIHKIKGYWPDAAHLQACGRAADDARANWEEKQIIL